jgi:hypothetical protein
MTTDVDICNRALSEIGARVLVTSMSENTPQGKQCLLQYAPMRKQVLRAAPWGFARKTIALTRLGLLTDDPPASPYPWLAKFAYPDDCLKVHYILATPTPSIPDGVPNVSNALYVPWCAPRRDWRYLPAYDDSTDTPAKVILTNIPDVLGIYTADIENPDLWDDLFQNALVMALANKLVLPLTGNVAMKNSYAQLCEQALTQARVVDGNEAIPNSDSVPDWISARGGTNYLLGQNLLGNWYSGWDAMNWGM